MSSILLQGNDFISNSNFVQTDQKGNVVIDSVRSNDYNVAIVSRDAFDFTTGNKSVRFVFSAAPYTTAARKGLYGAGSKGRFAAIVDDGKTVEWKGDTFSSSCQGTPDCTVMSEYDCSRYYSVDASSTHTIVKTGNCIGTSGDNTNKQLDISSPETVESIACGNGFSMILRNTGVVELIGDDKGGDLVVPDSCKDFSENVRPIQVVAGEDFFTVLKRDGSLESVGSIKTDDIKVEEPIVGISSGDKHILVVSLNGTVYAFGDNSSKQAENPQKKALKISAASNRSTMLGEDGFVYEWGESISNIQKVTSIPANVQVIDVIAGESFTIAVIKDRTLVISGSLPSYLDDISGEKIGNAKSVEAMDDAYDYFPMLKDITGINIMAGVQEDNLDSSYHLFKAKDGSNKPIVVGRDGYKSIFTGMKGAFKGTILAKIDNGDDMCFDLKGSEYNPFTATGHLPVSSDFITSNAGEKYEVIITFSPFGKVIRFRKTSGEYIQDVPFKYLSVEETGYSSGRVALYLRNAKDFILDYAEVTDEMNAELLPPEIVYRDIDTAVLHTKAAEMVVDISDAVESSSTLAKLSSVSIKKLNEDYKTNLKDIFSRLEKLESK